MYEAVSHACKHTSIPYHAQVFKEHNHICRENVRRRRRQRRNVRWGGEEGWQAEGRGRDGREGEKKLREEEIVCVCVCVCARARVRAWDVRDGEKKLREEEIVCV